MQEYHYYPFGMAMDGNWVTQTGLGQKYLYNGKELVDDLGLNWYDYGARWYDASVGRWMQVGPLAEAMPSWSAYSYVAGNPVKLIDPSGMFGVDYKSVRRERDAKWEERRQETEAQANQVKLPVAYYANVAGLSTTQLGTIFNYAAEIFEKNGYDGLIFENVSVEEAKKHTETYEKQMFLAIINVEYNKEKASDPGKSALQKNGRIGVYHASNVINFPFNGFESWVNMAHSDIANHKGDKNYAAGYIVAHEILHQIVSIASFYLTGDGRTNAFHREEGRPHLNRQGVWTTIPSGPSKKLHPEEEILEFHKNIIDIFKN